MAEDQDKVKLNEKEVTKEQLEAEKKKAEQQPDVKIEQVGPNSYRKKITG